MRPNRHAKSAIVRSQKGKGGATGQGDKGPKGSLTA